MLYLVCAGMIISSASKTLFLDLSARDSRGLLILKKRSCDKNATKCIAIQKRRNPQKNRYFYMFILYKLFTRVFEFHLILRDKIF